MSLLDEVRKAALAEAAEVCDRHAREAWQTQGMYSAGRAAEAMSCARELRVLMRVPTTKARKQA